VLAAVSLLGAVTTVAWVGTASSAGTPCTLCAGGEYHAIAPVRVFDTRSAAANGGVGPINDVAPKGVKAIGPTSPSFDIDVLGLDASSFVNRWLPAGTSSSDVLAVVAGITVVAPTSDGYLGVYPPGFPPAVPSAVVNYRTGKTVSNLAILRPDSSGRISLSTFGVAAGTVDVFVDVFGWMSSSTYTNGTPDDTTDERGARLVPVEPKRILDTRNDAAVDTPIGAGGTLLLPIRGVLERGGSTVVVPNDPKVVGVLMNLTVVQPTADGFVSVLPAAPSGVPGTANAVTSPGLVKGTLAMVPVGPDGSVVLYNSAGSTNVVVDVMGYLLDGQPEASRTGRVVPLATPFRAFNTRDAAFGSLPLGPGQSEDWGFTAFANSVTIGGVAVGKQLGVLGNLTNASLARQVPTGSVTPSYLTVFPSPGTASPPPLIANLNSVEGAPVGNLALVKFGANETVRVYNARGYAHYVLDVNAVVLSD
jgi:hypothetical protein